MLSKWILSRLKKKTLKKRVTKLKEVKLNLQKDKKDVRDKQYALKTTFAVGELPPEVLLQEYCPPIKNQGSIGSCGAHAYISAYETLLNMHYPDWFIEGSEIYHYYFARELLGWLPKDSGMTLREGAKALKNSGFCPEALCPYDVRTYNNKPKAFAQGFAKYIFKRKFPITEYNRMWSAQDMVQSVSQGLPVIVGLKIYSDFFSYRSGPYKTPTGKYLGGHAMLIVGYNLEKKVFLVKNSWGTGWGLRTSGFRGYCWIHFDYVRKNLIDAWTINI